VYEVYASEDDALTGFLDNNVDMVLKPNGLSQNTAGKISNSLTFFFLESSQTRNLGFVAINRESPNIADPILRQAMACMADQEMVNEHQTLPVSVAVLETQVALLNSFTVSEGMFSNHADTIFPCSGPNALEWTQAVRLLSSGGYSWSQPPSDTVAGQGLKLPNGKSFPPVTLLSLKSDQLQALVGLSFQQAMRLLGIPLTAQPVSQDEIDYAVFSSHQYDMALLGWNVSEYPGYLCNWFKDGNPFGYQSDRLQSACEALNSTSDLSTAQKDVYEIQSILAQDLPFIPLYSGITYDAYRNIKYPFDSMLGGLSGVYGAPSLAIPAP